MDQRDGAGDDGSVLDNALTAFDSTNEGDVDDDFNDRLDDKENSVVQGQ